MPVTSTTSSVSYTGNASAVTPYAIPFYFINNSEIKVTKVLTSTGEETVLVLDTDFTLTGEGVPAGGEMVTLVAIPATYTVAIYREVAETQLAEVTFGGSFPSGTMETALDKLTMLVQQALRKIARCFRVSEASDAQDAIPALGAINRVICIDASGNAVAMTGAELLALLELPGTVVDKPTATWNNDAERALKVPDFIGQFGMQFSAGSSAGTIFVSNGLTAGAWAIPSLHTGDVTTPKILDSAVTAAKLGSNAVTEAKINAGAVTAAKIGGGAVLASKLYSGGAQPFRGSKNAVQSIPNATATVLTWPVEDIDTAAQFASNRFTPITAGYYRLNVSINTAAVAAAGTTRALSITKNGVAVVTELHVEGDTAANPKTLQVSTIVLANGTTDYFEATLFHDHGSSLNTTSTSLDCYFEGHALT